MNYTPLTDGQVDTVTQLHWTAIRTDVVAAHRAFANPLEAHRRYARAIEAAATAPLLARIAELERKSDQDDETILWQAANISRHLDRIAELEERNRKTAFDTLPDDYELGDY